MQIYGLQLFLWDWEAAGGDILIDAVLELEQLDGEEAAGPDWYTALFIHKENVVFGGLLVDDLWSTDLLVHEGVDECL